ncbi:trihelix transcription factor DF1-like isoform X1 [Vigna umbellata]|uniref:trihelix transcription factor DF1-like isoform X1 n=1 Tax=Vigna umbellata TaxID=87088 RepID=UPI001F5F5A41|nr:trihelix transcription factor DF1-like isoform X1 [Vigna umbellata]
MQLGDSSVLEISSHSEPEMAVAAAAEGAAHGGEDDGGDDEMIGVDVDGNSGEGNEGNKMSFGGNRWPRQETLALLKIRSDMDAVFRDSSLKGPLWEEVSRKLAGLGYHRNAKKCKEKFENVYKYNKRTKENKSGKSHGKTYKFFDQLQALENHQFTISYPTKPQPTLATTNTLTLPARQSDHGNNNVISYVTPFPSTNPTHISPSPQTNTDTNTNTTTVSTTNPRDTSPPQTTTTTANNTNNDNVTYSLPNMNTPFSTTTTTSTSSSTASDEDLEERYRRKRKWKDYFRRLTRKVLLKQEEMQKKFLEAMDKRERERVAQQDNWRIQEMARINREHEILVQERSTAAAKDAAVIALLQKMYGQQNTTQHVQVQPPEQQNQTTLQSQLPTPMPNNNFEIKKLNNGHHSATSTSTVTTSPATSSSSRWPKAEVHALIRLRTSLDTKYQENGPKAPLWEDISIAMQRLGYNRSAKRCKEKWENINKYFKKMRDNNKERRENSKTCPYFHELDAIYKERSLSQNPFGVFQNMKPNEMMMMEPLMVQPEQQWRPPPQSLEEGIEKNSSDEYQEKEEENEGDDDDHVGVEEDEDGVEDEACETGTND